MTEMLDVPGGRAEEAVVYFVVSPTVGPGERIFADEDIYACGGVHNIERSPEAESYWYARIGEIQGELDGSSLTASLASAESMPRCYAGGKDWKCYERTLVLCKKSSIRSWDGLLDFGGAAGLNLSCAFYVLRGSVFVCGGLDSLNMDYRNRNIRRGLTVASRFYPAQGTD
jgi:hypothetical protein